jgi:ABC-2 type transport system ATP-binding protein/lipopolysaccharide transport system ATP-binding protein
MVYLRTEAVSVDFPIYSASSRSLKNRVLRFGGAGHLSTDTGRITVQALRDVTANFEHGDRVGLVGRNGAGKTTLLRVLAGVYEPTHGRVSKQGQVAPLFDVALGMDLEGTGYENILLRGLMLGLSRKQIRERTDEIVQFTELGDYLSVPLRTYSSGMMLRLAFAVSTSIEPEILLMDEWIGVGDAHFITKAEVRLQGLVDRAGIMVIASHSNALIRKVCNKALLMDQGRVVATGGAEEVLAQYEAMQ